MATGAGKMALIIAVAFLLDCLIGDPQNPLHPIRIIGNGIALGTSLYRKARPKSPAIQFIAGATLAITIISLSFLITWLITWLIYRLGYWPGVIGEAIICYFLIAPKSLKDESMKVYRSLEAGDIEQARVNLSWIVGRDTAELSEGEIIKATVETIAENLSDGVIAPLLFIMLGGAPLGMAYKAVNTLDSMLGYRNEEFEYFGKFAARFDDVVNFIPARISAWMLIASCTFAGGNIKEATRIYLRDRLNHKSPNSAQTESVCAGALGLQLGGDHYYHGLLVTKPTIGDELNQPVLSHINQTNRLMYAATICTVIMLVAIGVAIQAVQGF